VVICIDGVDPAYVDDAFDRGLTPRLRELADHGAYAVARSQIPSFTNPNNLSIVTGAPPVVHGLPGNHHLDRDGREVQLTDPLMLRAPSIHAALAAAGLPVLAVTTIASTTPERRRAVTARGGGCDGERVTTIALIASARLCLASLERGLLAT
jgi:phosphonoacetate hydrolase